jgi:ABC-type branched-subunit amino acid transport system ATPase component
MATISVQGLRKNYGTVRAVDELSFEVAEGELCALLGPNGAGKTTTVEILEGHRTADAGRVRVLGFDPAAGQRDFRERIGIVLQEAGFDEEQTVRELVEMYAGLYPRQADAGQLIALVGLDEKADARVKTLSGGQRRRLDLALGLAGAHLVIVARREEALREAAEGLRAEAIAADIIAADLASPEAGATLAAACERLGRTIDILVNVAGLNLRQPFMQVSAEGFDLHMAVQLRAPFLLTQAFAPGMAQRGYGRIVNIASLQSYRAFPDCAPYGAAKGGVVQLTRAIAEEWSRHGVTSRRLAL